MVKTKPYFPLAAPEPVASTSNLALLPAKRISRKLRLPASYTTPLC
jgi:hypothetical protein